METTYNIIQPPQMSDEEFGDFLEDITSIIFDTMCADCEHIKTCNGKIACSYFTEERIE